MMKRVVALCFVWRVETLSCIEVCIYNDDSAVDEVGYYWQFKMQTNPAPPAAFVP